MPPKVVETPTYVGQTVVLKLRYKTEYPVYLEVWFGGKPLNFAKKNLVGFKVFTPPGELLKWVEVQMPLDYAKKRGLSDQRQGKHDHEPGSNADAMYGVHPTKKRDQKFAKSLIDQYAVKGKLTEKQWVWVEKLADEIDYAGVPDFTKNVA